LRKTIGFAAQRLMELEVESLTGAAYGEKSPERLRSVTTAATAFGRPMPARSNCVFPSCARVLLARFSGVPPTGASYRAAAAGNEVN